MKRYRYRDHASTTHSSIERALKHTYKCGSLFKIIGYIHGGRTHVMVKGCRGTARFDAFAWGYGGTGPNGLNRFLTHLAQYYSITAKQISDVLNTPWFGPKDDMKTNRTIWTLRFGQNIDCAK